MNRAALLDERDRWKRAENAAILCNDLRAAFEALKEVETIDLKLRELREDGRQQAA